MAPDDPDTTDTRATSTSSSTTTPKHVTTDVASPRAPADNVVHVGSCGIELPGHLAAGSRVQAASSTLMPSRPPLALSATHHRLELSNSNQHPLRISTLPQ